MYYIVMYACRGHGTFVCFMYVCMRVCMHVCTCIYISITATAQDVYNFIAWCVCAYACTHTHTHTHTRTHTRITSQPFEWRRTHIACMHGCAYRFMLLLLLITSHQHTHLAEIFSTWTNGVGLRLLVLIWWFMCVCSSWWTCPACANLVFLSVIVWFIRQIAMCETRVRAHLPLAGSV